MPTSSSDASVLGLLDEDHLHALASEAVDRRGALRQAGALGARVALTSVPLALAAAVRPVFGQTTPPTVTEVLNFALTLEYLEAEFYRQLIASNVASSREEVIFEVIEAHEQAHVSFLRSVLGADAVSAPTFDFTAGGLFDPFGSFGSDPDFLRLAQAFEDLGVRAYKGQVANLIGTDVLDAALRIHSVEARHAAFVRGLRSSDPWINRAENTTGVPAFDRIYNGEDEGRQFISALNLRINISLPDAYDEPLTMEDVLDIIAPFIVG
ncbi:MAG: ferritin-like domain-containing protein [Bacteroidota bacterium]